MKFDKNNITNRKELLVIINFILNLYLAWSLIRGVSHKHTDVPDTHEASTKKNEFGSSPNEQTNFSSHTTQQSSNYLTYEATDIYNALNANIVETLNSQPFSLLT